MRNDTFDKIIDFVKKNKESILFWGGLTIGTIFLFYNGYFHGRRDIIKFLNKAIRKGLIDCQWEGRDIWMDELIKRL